MGAVVLGAVAAVLAGVLPAAADPGVSISFDGAAGAFPVNGYGDTWETPDQEVRIWEYDNVITFDGDKYRGPGQGWTWLAIELSGADGAPLSPGTYTGVTNRYQHPENTGIVVIRDGLACGLDVAEFTITTLERDPDTGRLTAFDAEITQRCGSPTAPVFTATLHLAS
ncbi:hypothetical protein [Actinokineospora globicatena]|uniref:Uncharacterized protein n=1 Tax=Actinokineospora globicatena TaxID=103729 RepID=A0A9W6QNP7_9PSEU|nr:hypothetical protein [Actinokineospora globicatena]GLW92907.1 hypothetical protein Aglo03_37230 [Actinokineospora globicatena]